MKTSSKCDFPVDQTTRQETRHHGDSSLPIGIYCQHTSEYRLGYAPWHWHKEAELYFVTEGSARVITTEGETVLHETEGCFINSNCLHSMRPHECDDVIYHSVVFDPFIISSSISMLFDEKYIYPLLRSKQVSSIIIDSDCPLHSFIYEKISQIVSLNKKKTFGYEIILRNSLSEIWFQLLNLADEKMKNPPRGAGLDQTRIHAMLTYIHEHYTSDLTSEQIAAAASVSVSECCRCFQRCLKQSPFDYLIEYRIRQAAGMLLDTDKPISEICMETGFNSTSYFSNKFKSILGQSPRDYRKTKGVL